MQEVNFCDVLNQPGRFGLNFHRSLWVVGGFSALLMIVFILQFFYGVAQFVQTAYLSFNEGRISAKLEKLLESSDKIKFVNDLEQAILVSTQEVTKHRDFLQKMSDFNTANIQFKPSQYFHALENAITPQVWLTKIDLSQQGQKIELSGFTRSVLQLRQFAAQLQNEKEFQDKNFSKLMIQHAENDEKIGFSLGTADAPETKDKKS